MMLVVEDIHFSYGEKKLLQGLSLQIKKNEIVSIIGRSGSGKTTLFRLITGLIGPQCGKIMVDGADPITYMHQRDLLLPWRTVLGNLLLFAELGKSQGKKELEEEALDLLDRMGLEGCAKLYPEELSGGMRQRVALARALLQNRPILLLDEPFGSLDVIVREQLYELLREIRDLYSKTILLVTHDFRDALTLSDRILVLARGEIAAEFEVKNHSKEILSEEIRATLQETL